MFKQVMGKLEVLLCRDTQPHFVFLHMTCKLLWMHVFVACKSLYAFRTCRLNIWQLIT